MDERGGEEDVCALTVRAFVVAPGADGVVRLSLADVRRFAVVRRPAGGARRLAVGQSRAAVVTATGAGSPIS